MGFLERQIERLKSEKYAGIMSEGFLYDVERLKKGEPYEYVLGHTVFLGVHIDLSYHPMIPRSESAFWVERAIAELREKYGEHTIRLADAFSGSGNIACALLVNLPNAYVDVSEKDPKLKKQIEINVKKNNIDEHRVRIITSSALEGLEGTYDALFAIPPYIPYEALPELDKEQQDFEPHLAFFAHDNGHEFHKTLIKDGWDLLNEGGTLYMEADMDQNEAIREMVGGTRWSKLEFWEDPYGATPNVVLRK